MSDPIVSVKKLQKTFAIGFFRKKVEAVRDVSFEVMRGEIFGLVGPNGAGKTTTIKTLLDLVRPTTGEVRLFGLPVGNRLARAKIGYLPESPYIYQYLRIEEFLDLCGRISGMNAEERAKRIPQLIERVGLSHAKDRQIRRFSKGMLQRAGLAQALLADPELLILDEPMSGLDPIGRKEVRDLILEEKQRGKTILFTSHILSDVETLCDRVAIVHRGAVTDYGSLSQLLKPDVRQVEVELDGVSESLRSQLESFSQQGFLRLRALPNANAWALSISDATRVSELVRFSLEQGAHLVSLHEQKETLEELFLRDASRNKASVQTNA